MTDAFISYSRRDTDFVHQVFDALSMRQREAWVDWQGIDYSTKWWEEICTGIENADNFILIVSPDSLNSIYCHREIEHARNHGKRIITLLYRPIDEAALVGGWYTHLEMKPLELLARENWEAIKTLQWIDYPKLNNLNETVDGLLKTIDTDPERVKQHTRLLLRVRDWESRGRSPSALLRGDELAAYEQWQKDSEAQGDDPKPTPEQVAYIAESRRTENESIAAERHRVKELNTARNRFEFVIVIAVAIGIGITVWFYQVNARATSLGRLIEAQVNNRNDLDAAISAYTEAINFDPGFPLAYIIRGIARADKGDLDGAIADYSKAIELDPKNPSAYSNRGNIRRNKGDLDGAIADYNKVIELAPNLAVVYNNLAIVWHTKGDLDRAITEYSKAIEADPKYALAYSNRSIARIKKSDFDGAITDCTRAIEISPKFALAYLNCGDARRGKNDLDRAIADYSKAIELDSKLALTYYERGITYRRQAKYTEALADFRHYVELAGAKADPAAQQQITQLEVW